VDYRFIEISRWQVEHYVKADKFSFKLTLFIYLMAT